MRIGIIGAGNIGGTLTKLFSKARMEVYVSFSRDQAKLDKLATNAGGSVKVSSPSDAVSKTDLCVLAIPLSVIEDAKAAMGKFAGRTIVDANNGYGVRLLKNETASGYVLRHLPGIRLVKAFNTLNYKALASKGFKEPPMIMPFCTDDHEAGKMVKGLIDKIGFYPFDLGLLSNVWIQEQDGPLYGKEVDSIKARKLVDNLKEKP